MKRALLVCAVVVAGLLSASVSSSAAAASSPAPISLLGAYDTGHAIKLAWTNPRAPFDHVVVRVTRGTHAPGPTDGRGVPAGKHAQSAVITGLAPNTQFTAAVWTRGNGKSSPERSTTFTTAPAPRRAPVAAKGTVAGVVTDTAGHPLRRADVDVFSAVTTDESFVRTDAAGHWSARMPAGAYDVIVSGLRATGGTSDGTGYLARDRSVVVRTGKTTQVPTVRLAPGGELVGRVVDGHGRPVRNVLVMPQAVQDFVGGGQNFPFGVETTTLGFPSTITGADGRFTIKGMPDDAVQLCLAPVPAGPQFLISSYGTPCGGRSYAVAAGHTIATGDQLFVAAPAATGGGTVRVHVVDEHGHPITDADGSGANPSTGDDFSLSPAGTGILQATHVQPGHYRMCVDAQSTRRAPTGYLQRCDLTVSVRAGRTTQVTARLRTAGAVEGTVYGTSGHRVPGADVVLGTNSADGGSGWGGEADGFGHYLQTGLTPGVYTMCADAGNAVWKAEPRGLLPSCRHGQTFAVTAGLVRTGIDATLSAGSALTGTVTDSHGRPVNGAQIDLEAGNTGGYGENFTDSRGRYTIGGLQPRRYRVCAAALFDDGRNISTCRPGVAVHPHSTARANLRLPAYGAANVTVRDSGGHPLIGADVALLSPCSSFGDCDTFDVFGHGAPVDVDAAAVTDSAGAVKLDGLAAGRYAVCVFGSQATSDSEAAPDGWADQCSSTYDLTVSVDHTATRAVTVAGGATVSGRVTNAAGKPIGNVTVTVSGAPVHLGNDQYGNIGLTTSVVTGADGTYSVRSATPGQQTICFQAPGYEYQCLGGKPGAGDSTPVTITAGSNPGLNIVLTRGSSAARPAHHGVRAKAHRRAAQKWVLEPDGMVRPAASATAR